MKKQKVRKQDNIRNMYSENGMLSYEKNIGSSTVFIIIPFSFELEKDLEIDLSLRFSNKESYNFPLVDSSNLDSHSLIKQFFDRDCELFSAEYANIHSFKRGLISGVEYLTQNEQSGLSKVTTNIILTFHENNYGTITIINSLESMPVKKFIDTISELKNIEELQVNNGQRDLISLLRDIIISLTHLESKKIRDALYIELSLAYPYISIGASELQIEDIDKFVNDNKALVYGLLHQDLKYNGWKRIREDLLSDLINKNLSRRKEYGLYISTLACVEIDNKSRKDFIIEWAQKKHTSNNNMRLKLLFERAALLEILVLQKYILLKIDVLLSKCNSLTQKPISRIIAIKEQVTNNLATYYYATSISDQHISGVEWIMYGRQRMGIDNLFEGVMKRLELAESNQELKMEINNIRGNYIFQLVSVFLGYSALSDVIDSLVSVVSSPNSIISKMLCRISLFSKHSTEIIEFLQNNNGGLKIIVFLALCLVMICVTIHYFCKK